MPRTINETISFERLLSDVGDSFRVARGEMIYQPGNPSDSVYVVEEGRVKLAYLDESGKKLTPVILDPGEIFGEMCLVGESLRRHLATAIEETLIRRVSRREFLEVIDADPLYLRLLLQHFARRVREFEEALEDLAFRDIQARLSRQLLKLSDEYGGSVGFVSLDVGESPETASKYKVRGIPTFVFFKDGEQVDRLTGAMPKAVFKGRVDSALK